MMKKLHIFWLMAFVVSCSKGYVDVGGGGQAKGKTLGVDKSGDAGQYVSVDLDGKNNAHMVYSDLKNMSLKYALQADTAFNVETVDAGKTRCLYTTIKVDSQGQPHIIYYSDAKKTLFYAYKKEGAWKTEKVEWGAGTGMGTRLLFDKEQKMHALYYSGDGYLKHAWRALAVYDDKPKKKAKPKKAKDGKPAEPEEEPPEGIWGSERVDKANGSEKVQISLVVQPNGRLAASYFHWSGLTSELRMALQGADGKWTTEVVSKENNPGKSSAMFFDVKDQPQIIFREARKDRLSIAVYSSEGWKLSPLMDKVNNLALAAGPSGDLLVAYQEMSGPDPRKGHLCMLLHKGGAWTNYDVDSARGSGSHLDAVMTSTGDPVIAYREEEGKSLKLFTP
jgi:hypothetical protein